MRDAIPSAGQRSAPIGVLVVDDSALVRSLLGEIINRAPDMRCVGAAPDPLVAREMIRALNPDVLTLDVEMPRMDGLDFLEKLMRLRPMPVVMVSTLTERGAEATMRALELGAIDFVAKPRIGIGEGLRDAAREITDKIRAAARARVFRKPAAASSVAVPSPASASSQLHAKGASALQAQAPNGRVDPPNLTGRRRTGTEQLIVIGSSTGGTEAVRQVLSELPADSPAVLIAQHMPPGFTGSFARRLDSLSRLSVSEARHGERILPGHAYVAPGGLHLRIDRSGADYLTVLDDGPPVNRHRPSVDVLFRSAARCAGSDAIGIMLTGMGKDGASAMREMRDCGAWNIAQDEASCVVFGMPGEAIQQGAVHEVLPLAAIGARLRDHLQSLGGTRNRV